jgi:hypothetical protein
MKLSASEIEDVRRVMSRQVPTGSLQRRRRSGEWSWRARCATWPKATRARSYQDHKTPSISTRVRHCCRPHRIRASYSPHVPDYLRAPRVADLEAESFCMV